MEETPDQTNPDLPRMVMLIPEHMLTEEVEEISNDLERRNLAIPIKLNPGELIQLYQLLLGVDVRDKQ